MSTVGQKHSLLNLWDTQGELEADVNEWLNELLGSKILQRWNY